MSECVCALCGCPTWPDCGFDLVAKWGPAKERTHRKESGEILLCPDCLNDPRALTTELSQRAGGCCLHVVVEDHNLGDDSIAWCKAWAVREEHTYCEHAADLLAAMTFAERCALFGVDVDEKEYGDA